MSIFLAALVFAIFYYLTAKGDLEEWQVLLFMSFFSCFLFNAVYDYLYDNYLLPHPRQFYFGIVFGLAVIVGALVLHAYNSREDS